MNETLTSLVQPLAYRVWDPEHRSFFYTDVRPETSPLLDRWTGLFDKQALPLYENDIIRVHYDWKFGWIRALIVRDARKERYQAHGMTSDRAVLRVGFYCFADSYRVGNIRQEPNKLVHAVPQFPAAEDQPWWLSSAVFRSIPRRCLN